MYCEIRNLTVILEDSCSHQRFNFFLGIELKEVSIHNFSLNVNNKEINSFDKNITEIIQNSSVSCSKIFQIIDLSLFLIPFEKNTRINLASIGIENEFSRILLSSEFIDLSNNEERKSSDYNIINQSNSSIN